MLNKELLEELILNINNRTGIRNDILEKDYYVCLVLKDLSKKQDKLQAYFKGGTAIYKILDHMNRFSEDIDLTVKVNDNESNNSNRMRLKNSAIGYKIQWFVNGREEYTVKILIDKLKKEIKSLECNCPCAEENNCKHMAAVLCCIKIMIYQQKKTKRTKRKNV